MRESKSQKVERATEIAKMLVQMYKRRKTVLTWSSPWECLVAIQLSAQCTDKRVNIVTPPLFARLPNVKAFAEVPSLELEEMIHSTGFYRNKSKNIKGAAQIVVREFDGRVPETMDELLKLPGMARKSANVLLFNAFDKVEGVAVDTHVMRITDLLGLISAGARKNPVKIEKEMMELLPKKYWGLFSLLITEHGREVCIARRPQCERCKFNQICPGSLV
jgi:endonuclease III